MSRVGESAETAAVEDLDRLMEMYRRMLLIRGFEDRVQSLFLRGEVYGTTHLYFGQEAVAVGFASALGPADRVACTYRGHGQALAKGLSVNAAMAEMLGRTTGCSKGKGGSMHFTDSSRWAPTPGACSRSSSGGRPASTAAAPAR